MVESRMPVHELTNYRHRGVRALVLLHEKELRALLPIWRKAKAAKVQLPSTTNPAYASLETVLRHALQAARSFMTWMCEKLELPDPGIDEAPEASRTEAEAERYVERLLERWRLPLAGLDEKGASASFKTQRGEDRTIMGMLEHAVAHPMRHRFQLEELMER
jgi:uncharacterized damage-inducible protein DinB